MAALREVFQRAFSDPDLVECSYLLPFEQLQGGAQRDSIGVVFVVVTSVSAKCPGRSKV